MTHFAHTKPGAPPSEWQSLDSHLSNVAHLSADWASCFDSEDWAWTAGWLHDLGKASAAFQHYLESSNDSVMESGRRASSFADPDYDSTTGKGRVNHSAAGAAFAEETMPLPVSRVLAYLCAGHHSGLADYFASETSRACLKERLKEGQKLLSAIDSGLDSIRDSTKMNLKCPSFVNSRNLHLWIRMLFSCLVDADRLDTEAFCSPDSAARRRGFAGLEDLKHDLDAHLELFKSDTQVNLIRKDVLAWCREKAQLPPGLFSLNVPTGGGKTLSGMAFALDHAVRYSKRRIIYVIPYTTIIEQTASVLRSISPRWEYSIIEHHSSFDPKRSTPEFDLAAENWDVPIVLTTNVQFFESLFSARPAACRKLHNLVDSVVILDEAQLITPEKLTPCVWAMNELVRNYGVTMLLSTATQPPLPKLTTAHEIVPDPALLHRLLRRTSITMPASLSGSPTSWPVLAAELAEHPQVLCVVNSRRDAYEIWRELRQLLPSDEEPFHLSTLLCGEHRSKTVSEIRRRLDRDERVRVISTQLIEAGVDLDFPVVYRAAAGLDSIAQAAGRCNREGRLGTGRGMVKVFVSPGRIPRGLLSSGYTSMIEIASLEGFDPSEPQWYTRYFEQFYSRLNDTGARFMQGLQKDAADFVISFRSVGDSFRLVDEDSRPLLVHYGEGSELIDQLERFGPNRDLLRKLQRHTVSLQSWLFEKEQRNIREIVDGFDCWNGPSGPQIDVDLFKETFFSEETVF
ncbi:MAG: CRISPR-associated endonuclease Cas3'' [Candidatus Fermentibacter sp.]|nr:CRISPR-associated endonuclease Cas3'' [Candidatus Fermentibacter sp.]